MALPIEDRPKPTTTTKPAERHKTAPSKPAPSAPKKTAPAAPKKKDDGPLPEARKAAAEGANEVKKAVDAQPTIERKIVVGAYKTGEAAVKTAVAGAGDIGKKVVEASKPLHEPFTREIKEAGKEVGKAGEKYGKGFVDSLNPFDEGNVKKAWDDAPTPERAVVFAGFEALKNVGKDTWNNVKNLGNLGKEVLEGAGEIWLHNPINNAIKEGVKGAVELGKKGVELGKKGVEIGIEAGKDVAGAVGGWFSDRINGGAEGAVKAGKTSAETGSKIVNRSVDQAKENARELKEAGKNFGDNFDGYSEISDAWNKQPTIERQLVVAGYEAVENTVQGVASTIVDSGNMAKEVVEAGVENVITGVENTGEAIAGGAKAVGNFVGGLFG
ncbi:MAG: hypothetical protein JWL76_1784 [Thermoleophilia bacterium]|nr:hypothetical protein [Thermoleophilia bacterium]